MNAFFGSFQNRTVGEDFQLNERAKAVDVVESQFDLAALPDKFSGSARFFTLATGRKLSAVRISANSSGILDPGGNGSSNSRRVLVALSTFGPL